MGDGIRKIDSTSAKHNNNQYSSHIPITTNLISTQKIEV
jgi:hypothetical protein